MPLTVSSPNNIAAIIGNGLALFINPAGILTFKDVNGIIQPATDYLGTVPDGTASDDTLQWNGAAWEPRADISLTMNVMAIRADDAIRIEGSNTLTIQDVMENPIITINEDTGDVSFDKGNITVTVGDVAAQSVNTSNAAGTSTFAGDISIGNITIDESADALVLAAASSLSFQNSALSNLLTIDEATGDVTIGNLLFDVSSNEIESSSIFNIRSNGNLLIEELNQGSQISMNGISGDIGMFAVGNLVIVGIPNSSAGLPVNAIWRDEADGGTLKQIF